MHILANNEELTYSCFFWGEKQLQSDMTFRKLEQYHLRVSAELVVTNDTVLEDNLALGRSHGRFVHQIVPL